jgi:hypothetical protein
VANICNILSLFTTSGSKILNRNPFKSNRHVAAVNEISYIGHRTNRQKVWGVLNPILLLVSSQFNTVIVGFFRPHTARTGIGNEFRVWAFRRHLPRCISFKINSIMSWLFHRWLLMYGMVLLVKGGLEYNFNNPIWNSRNIGKFWEISES